MVLSMYNRELHDMAAVVLHTASLAVALGIDNDFASSTPGALAVAQEALTVAFHLVYVYNYYYNNARGRANQLKWVEYAVTATIGTLATLATGSRSSAWYWVLFVVVAGVGQQTVGYRIDVGVGASTRNDWIAFGFAMALQVAEIVVVWAVHPAWRVALVYTLGWSAFGIHAGLRLYHRNNRDSRWGDIDWTEAVYSCLSWAAKLAVFWAVFARDRSSDDLVFGLTLALYAVVVPPVLLRTESP